MTAEGPGTITVASRLSGYLRGGGLLVPLITALLAFLVGGLVVAATGANPIDTYRAIFEGSGLNWLFPWLSGDDRTLAALNLQQTLILTTPLILTGLAVAFTFRAGLFNIGGQGQYLVGTFAAVYIGSKLDGTPALLHVVLAIVAGSVAGAAWAGIAGLLKATTGANEVVSTIMLNWTAVYVGAYLFGPRGPAAQRRRRRRVDPGLPRRRPGAPGCRSSGPTRNSQGLHIGIFIAVAVTALLLGAAEPLPVTGYEVRAVGFNPDAAEYAGISAGRNYVKVMVICGLMAGLAGALDVLGLAVPRCHQRHRGRPRSAISGSRSRCSAATPRSGRSVAALLFCALLNGSSVRNLDPTIFDPAARHEPDVDHPGPDRAVRAPRRCS